MLKAFAAHVRSNVVGYIALFVALGGTTYAATGGNFILGQANSAGTPTKLSSPTTDAAGALKVANTSTTGAGRGIVTNGALGGPGLWASGGNANKNTAAIHGQSAAGNAVEGISGKDIASGVYGQNNSTGYGVAGRSTIGTGVLGDSSGGNGVQGISGSGSASGVYGSNTSAGFGVAGRSVDGTGVMGDTSNGWAFRAFGNASQSHAGGGFVKAMAFVDPYQFADPIRQCFNSQLSATKATIGDCGITYSRSSPGDYRIDVGFQVDDRFASVTSDDARNTAGVTAASTTFHVTTWNQVFNNFADVPFYIVVY